MITLITGTPGAGKTLYAVKLLVEELLPSGRVVYTNIAGLNIEHPNLVACDDDEPFNWEDREDGAIFVFDEIQRQYRVRHSTAKVPPHISAFETHRHRGFDFYLITQGPKLIDRHLHELIEVHHHLHRAYGLQRTRLLTWENVNLEPQPPQSFSSAARKTFAFPEKYFSLYKSSSLHTVKRRLPWFWIVVAGLCLVAISVGAWNAYYFLGVGSDFVDEFSVDLERPLITKHAIKPCDFNIVGRMGNAVLAFDGVVTNALPAKKVSDGLLVMSLHGHCIVYTM